MLSRLFFFSNGILKAKSMANTTPPGGMTAAQRATLAVFAELYGNANGPDGFLVADENGVVDARVRPSVDTAAAINISVPPASELWVMSDNFAVGYGDGNTLGGLAANLNSESSLFVGLTGTPAQNAVKLRDAFTHAATRTPYGNALSATNPFLVFKGPGTVDLTTLAGNLIQPNFVGIKSLGGSAYSLVITDSTHRWLITQPGSDVLYSMIHGINFVSSAGSASWTIAFEGSFAPTISIDHEDIQFTGHTATESVMGFTNLAGSASPTFTGRVKNVRTPGQRLYGGHTTTPSTGNLTWDVRFEDCIGGTASFGGSSTTLGTRDGLLSGTNAGLYHCTHFGVGSNPWSAILGCPMIGCDWAAAVQRLTSDAYIRQTRITGIVSTYSITHNAAVNVRLAHNQLAGLINTGNVTNTLLGGTVDNAGNFTDQQV